MFSLGAVEPDVSTSLVLVSGAKVGMSLESSKSRLWCKGFHLPVGDCFAGWVVAFPGGRLSLRGGLGRLVLSDHPQVVSDHAPADPAGHTRVTVVAAPPQPLAAFQPADPPFNPRAPVTPLAEPALLLMGLARRRLAPRPRQHDLLHAALLCQSSPYTGSPSLLMTLGLRPPPTPDGATSRTWRARS